MAEQLVIGPVTWPLADGTTNQLLATDGAGNVVWLTPTADFATIRPEPFDLFGPLQNGHYAIFRDAFAANVTEARIVSRSGSADVALIRNLDTGTLTGEVIATFAASPTPLAQPVSFALANHDNLYWRVSNAIDLDSLYSILVMEWI